MLRLTWLSRPSTIQMATSPPRTTAALTPVSSLTPTDFRSHWTRGSIPRKNASTRMPMVGKVEKYKPASSRMVSSVSRASFDFRTCRQCRMIGSSSMPTDGTTARREATSSPSTWSGKVGSRYAAAQR